MKYHWHRGRKKRSVDFDGIKDTEVNKTPQHTKPKDISSTLRSQNNTNTLNSHETELKVEGVAHLRSIKEKATRD